MSAVYVKVTKFLSSVLFYFIFAFPKTFEYKLITSILKILLYF